MQYFFEIISVTPFLYCLPLFIIRTLFGYKLSKSEVIPYLISTSGSMLIIYWLLQMQDQIPLRSMIAFFILLLMFFIYVKAEPITIVATFGITVVGIITCEVMTFFLLLKEATKYVALEYDKSIALQLNILPMLAVYIIIYAIYFAKKNKLLKSISVATEQYVIALVIGLILVIAIILVMEIQQLTISNIQHSRLIYIMIYAVVFVVLAISACALFVRLSIREKQKNEKLRQFQETIVNLYDDTRMFRHNYKNMLIMLEGYYKHKDYDKLGELKFETS